MTPVELLGFGALALVGLALTGLFAGYETGVYTLNRVRLAVRTARGDRAATALTRELLNQNRTLATLLIGTNAASYLGSYALAALLHGAGLSDWAVIGWEVVIFTPLLFVFAETLPKDLFRTHTDRWSYALLWVLRLAKWLFTFTTLLPIVQSAGMLASRLLGTSADAATTARQRMSQLIKEGVGSGVLSEAQTTLADRALALRDRTVSAEMVPWKDVCRLPLSADPPHRLELLMARHNFTRLPVVDEAGRAVGVIAMLDVLLEPDRSTAQLMQPAVTFSPNTSVGEALEAMRTGRQAMAIVTAPSANEPLGLLTLKDLVEPLTGELAAW